MKKPRKEKQAATAGAEGRQRQYSAKEIDTALLQLAIWNGNYVAASRESGIPEATIRKWVSRATKTRTPPHLERYNEIVALKKSKRDRMLSCLLEVAFRGIIENMGDFKGRDFLTMFGIVMDKIIAGDSAGTEAGDILEKLLSHPEYAARIRRGRLKR